MKKTTKPTKKNPQDATRRNVQHANKALTDLDRRLTALETQAHDVWTTSEKVQNLELRMDALQKLVEARITDIPAVTETPA